MRITNGTRVIVSHLQGEEVGTVIGSTNATAGEQIRYTVRFDDRTQTSWSAFEVRPA